MSPSLSPLLWMRVNIVHCSGRPYTVQHRNRHSLLTFDLLRTLAAAKTLLHYTAYLLYIRKPPVQNQTDKITRKRIKPTCLFCGCVVVYMLFTYSWRRKEDILRIWWRARKPTVLSLARVQRRHRSTLPTGQWVYWVFVERLLHWMLKSKPQSRRTDQPHTHKLKMSVALQYIYIYIFLIL